GVAVSGPGVPAGGGRRRHPPGKERARAGEGLGQEEHGLNRERVAAVYALYEKKLAAAGALDFDDLIGRSVRLLRERPDILASERRRIRHLLIDEYQDTNAAQDALVKLLGEGADSLCAVGDEDQAIYRWRGAEVEHIL